MEYTPDISSNQITPFAVNGYYPLYATEQEANNASSDGLSHSHYLNSITYYMPNTPANGQYITVTIPIK